MSESELGARTISKVRWRLLPFMILCFFIAFIDRVNVGFAALEMNKDLGFTATVYGFGAGVFFLGYFLFEVPSNVILERVGARLWIARIMITWGIVAGAMAFIVGEWSFYVTRFMLGVAEAGFFPGMILYITYWFPARERARTTATFILGLPISVIVGAPLSTAIMQAMEGVAGVRGWQWLYIVEAVPALVVGVVALRYLTDRPEKATWLTPEERGWLASEIGRENAEKSKSAPASVKETLSSGKVWVLSLAFLCNVIPIYGLTLWMPLIVRGFGGLSTFQVGLVSALPYLCAAVVMILNGRHSDRTGERKWHILIGALIGAAGFTLAASVESPALGLVGLCIAASGIWMANTVFWTVPSSMLAGVSAAAGIGFINAFGNLGGFVGPYVTGWIRDTSGSFSIALFMLAAFLVLHGLIVFAFLRGRGAPALTVAPAE